MSVSEMWLDPRPGVKAHFWPAYQAVPTGLKSAPFVSLYAAGSRADVKSGALLVLILIGFLFQDRAPEAFADILNLCIGHETDVSHLSVATRLGTTCGTIL